MHILVIHQYYLFPGAAGGSRFNEFARLWSAAGHRVTVIAGNLDYTTGKVPAAYRGRWLVREPDGDVDVWRCHVPPTYSRSYVGRMGAFAGFTAAAMHAVLRVDRPDVVVASSPPLVTALPGWLAARRHRAPWVFEMRDLWPESAITTGVLKATSPIAHGLYALERWACRQADRINVLTPAFRDDLRRRQLADEAKILFIPNGADTELFSPGPADTNLRRSLGWGERLVALYAGAHGRANALRQLIDAAEHLRQRPDILIACVGDGPERQALQREVERRQLGNILFQGARPKSEMPALIRACDIGVAVLQNNPTFRTVYPNKVFDYMACEKPVLLAIDGVARQLVCEQAQAGVFAEPENAAAIARALIELADDAERRHRLGEQGRAWVLANASRDTLAKHYLQALQALAPSAA